MPVTCSLPPSSRSSAARISAAEKLVNDALTLRKLRACPGAKSNSRPSRANKSTWLFDHANGAPSTEFPPTSTSIVHRPR